MATKVTKDLSTTTTLLNSKYPSVSKLPKSTAVYLDEIRREYKMQVDGRKRYQKRQESLRNLSNRNSSSNLVESALDVVSEALRDDVKRVSASDANKTGPTPGWLDIYTKLDLDVLALLGLSTFMDCVGSSKTKGRTLTLLGRAVEMELFAKRLREFDDKMAKRIDDQVRKAHSSMRYRIKAAKAIARKSGFEVSSWDVATTGKMGAPLYNAIMEHSNLFEEWTLIKNKKSITYINLTEEADEAMVNMDFVASWQAPMFSPMIVEPRPWTSQYSGCYMDDSMAAQVPLVKSAVGRQRVLIDEAIDKGTLQSKLDALNAIQSTPFTINDYTHQALLWAWRTNQVVRNMPLSQKLPLLERPANWDNMDVEQRKGWTIDARNIVKKNREITSGRLVMKQDLVTAQSLSRWSKFYLPHNWDFRGRVYPVPSLSHHRHDCIKALFYHTNTKPVGEDGLYWIKLKVADNGDFDKISKKPLAQRIEWVDRNLENCLAVGRDFEASIDLWRNADKPFQYLAACRELYMVHVEGLDYHSGLPIGLDGSNSGVQHYSGASLSAEGFHVNLTVSEEPQDLYAKVADHVVTSINKDDASDAVVNAWQKFGVGRKTVKRNVMTYPYSSNLYGFRDQIVEDFMRPINSQVMRKQIEANPFEVNRDGGFKAAGYLARKSWAAVNEIIADAAVGMDFFRKLSRLTSHEGKHMEWVTPLGFPVVQRYSGTTLKKIKMFLYDRETKVRRRSQITYKEPSGTINKPKSSSAVAPNIIHSQDSCHLHMTVLECMAKHNVRDFFMIHDSFGCVAADAWSMYYAVRTTFIKLYTDNNLYEDLLNQVKQQLDNPDAVKLPELPERGDLDLSQVLDSRYCFI
jgi:DNA-directed RNA polymerase, mitochondrial